jgi:hypothetical protein
VEESKALMLREFAQAGSANGTGGALRALRRRYVPFSQSGGIYMLISALVTFLVVILILYLVNLLPLDGRAKQIVRVIVIILGVLSLLKYIAVF